MSEADIVEAITSYMTIANSQTTQAVGLLFGYSIVAYLIGAKLSGLQVLVLNALYVPLYISMIAAAVAATTKAIEYAERLKEVRPDDAIFLGQGNQIFSTTFGFLTLLASLWFMWSMRHTKTENQMLPTKAPD